MVIFINGAFGVGKTTVARHLRSQIPGSMIFDPEVVGFILKRLPDWVPLEGRGSDDFQDLPLWRRLSLLGIRLSHEGYRCTIVPMAFSNLAYLRELVEPVRRFDPDVHHFCLTAPFAVVSDRVVKRGGSPADPSMAWQLRRAEECCMAHRADGFAEHIATEGRTPLEIAFEITARLA